MSTPPLLSTRRMSLSPPPPATALTGELHVTPWSSEQISSTFEFACGPSMYDMYTRWFGPTTTCISICVPETGQRGMMKGSNVAPPSVERWKYAYDETPLVLHVAPLESRDGGPKCAHAAYTNAPSTAIAGSQSSPLVKPTCVTGVSACAVAASNTAAIARIRAAFMLLDNTPVRGQACCIRTSDPGDWQRGPRRGNAQRSDAGWVRSEINCTAGW